MAIQRMLWVTALVACACSGGSASNTGTGGAVPTISFFTATPDNLPAGGGTVTLAWSFSNATSSKISGPGTFTALTATSASGYVADTATFTLSATNSVGTSTATTTVTVAAPIDYAPQFVGTWVGTASGGGAEYSYSPPEGSPETIDIYPEVLPASWPDELCYPPQQNRAATVTVTEVSANVIQLAGLLGQTIVSTAVTASDAELPPISVTVDLFELVEGSCMTGNYSAPDTFGTSVVTVTNGQLEIGLTGQFFDPVTTATHSLTYAFVGTKE